jgi:NAD(P)-dependent dehydrogenase (short-subunit alcohol dehydrogenase family)
MKKIALITGANRGIGLETAKQMKALGYDVILTSRNADEGKRTAYDLGLGYHQLDVTSAESISALTAYMDTEYGNLDVLINNAGILLDRTDSILTIPVEKVQTMFETNTLAPLNLIRALLPLMKKNGYGRIVNVSSQLGAITNFSDYTPAYRLTKLALNGVTCMLADALKGTNILVNAVHPGWVKTDMGGAAAPLSLEEGAQNVIWAATLPDDGTSGGFFYEGKPMDW